jgi:glycosidase
VTLVGGLQSELGCAADWAPECTATDLVQDGSTYSRVFTIPAGSWELKIAINHSWSESYGAAGGSANIPLALTADAAIRVSYDDLTHLVTVSPADLPGSATGADRALAVSSLRSLLTKERFYFLMADRFANGDPGNDAGGLTGSRMVTGLDPADKGFYHGGDLKGITQKLDYIKGLGTTAIWLTPSFKNNPVQGSGENASAGYHGYWITDFTQIDPHLGTNQDMKDLISAAHAKGMKVFFDIITNHTADIIDYEEGAYTYVSKEAAPYRDASGDVFDDLDFAGKNTFPALDPEESFPYTPVFRTEADETVKVPAWLNDPTLYHNRGDSTFAGESSTYGDFVGLDDLFTENHQVVDGMVDIYNSWVDLGIDGFRIDTVKHVNNEFWQKFGPALMDHAADVGNDDFFMFGEVYDSSPSFTSQYSTSAKLPATLDFGFQNAALGFAQGKATAGLRDMFAGDDWYTDHDSNAYNLPTFLGNHDMGRQTMMLKGAGFSNADILTRNKLANALMYLTRGQPVVYYGDEQGFMGSGGDKDSRQDMFATQVAQYAAEDVIGGSSGSKDRFITTHPLFKQIAGLAKLRAGHPALENGAQIHRYASNSAGVFAVSRIDKKAKREYLVLANNAETTKTVTLATYSASSKFVSLYGGGADLRADAQGRVTATLPALSARVYRANSVMTPPTAAPVIIPTAPITGGTVGGRAEISAAIADTGRFAEVSFYFRHAGTSTWKLLGTDDNPLYRVYQDVRNMPKGTLLEYRIIAKDLAGNVSATSSYAFVGEPAGPVGNVSNDPPATQPGFVSIPGSHGTEIGCAGDWDPGCAEAQLALDPNDQIWKKVTAVPAGDYEFKAALNKSWDENYGVGGARNGSNINYKPAGGQVGFYYDPATHWVTNTVLGDIITAPGSFGSELGCTADWLPECMRPWLQDPDGDGTYTWASVMVPAGAYEFRVAHKLAWDQAYPAGNVGLTVPKDGMLVTISYKLSDHSVGVSVTQPSAVPDLTVAKAVFVAPNVVAYPSESLPLGVDPATLSWRLHWSANGGLSVDAEGVTGGSTSTLTRDPAGLPPSVLSSHPELAGYVALTIDHKTAKKMTTIMAGQVALGLYDGSGKLLDATGVKPA